jgi:hypothetical protein
VIGGVAFSASLRAGGRLEAGASGCGAAVPAGGAGGAGAVVGAGAAGGAAGAACGAMVGVGALAAGRAEAYCG